MNLDGRRGITQECAFWVTIIGAEHLEGIFPPNPQNFPAKKQFKPKQKR